MEFESIQPHNLAEQKTTGNGSASWAQNGSATQLEPSAVRKLIIELLSLPLAKSITHPEGANRNNVERYIMS